MGLSLTESVPQIAGFRITGVLGHGSAGTVYLAEQVSLERQVALKVLHPKFDLPNIHARFRREAQLLGDIHHPNVIRFLGYGKSPHPYLVMEYLAGGTLKDRIREAQDARRQGIDSTLAMVIARELFSALEALHQAGLVHRDLKPGNILFRESGEAVLGDLGLAGHLNPDDTRLTGAGDILGTLPYMAPELLKGSEHSISSDLFAMGVTLYEAVTGNHPTDYAPIPSTFQPQDPVRMAPGCPRALGELILSLLNPDPGRRPRSAASALARLLQRPTASIQMTQPVARSRSRVWFAGGILVAALVLGLGVHHASPFRSSRRAVPLSVQSAERGVLLRAAEVIPGSFLCIFDSKDKVVRCVDGETQDATTLYDLRDLLPGAKYTARTFRRDADSGGRSQSQVTFSIPPRVTVYGLESGRGSAALWIACNPEARASWVGGRARIPAKVQATRIPLEAGTEGTFEKLRLEFDGWGEICVTFSGLAKRPVGTPVNDLGVRMERKDVEGIEDGEGRHTAKQWLERYGVRLVSLRPDANGWPSALGDRSVQETLGRDVEIFHEFDTRGAPETLAWTATASEAARTLVINPDWFGDSLSECGDDPARLEREMAEVRTWQDWAKNRSRPFHLIAPLPGWTTRTPDVLASLMTAMGRCEAIGGLVWADMPSSWEEWSQGINRALGNRGSILDVRWTWQVGGRASELVRLDPFFVSRSTSSAPARSFLLARIHSPQSREVIDITALRHPGTGKLGRSWTRIAELARSLTGVVYQRAIHPSSKDLPRIESPGNLVAASFAGDGRRVLVLMTVVREKASVRIIPAGPGILRSPTEDIRAPYADRLVLTPDPIEAELSDVPMIYEEMVKIVPDAVDPATVRLEEPAWSPASPREPAP